MKARFFTIADLSNYPAEDGRTIDIETHVFDTENEEDIEVLEEYLPTVEGITEKQLNETALRILEDDCHWGQRMVPYVILAEAQMKELREKIGKL